MNRQANLDTSERGTLVPPNPTNGIKNTEMPTNQPTVDNSPTCHTCTHYNPYRHRPHLGIAPEPHCHKNPTNTHPCPYHEPADQSTNS